MKRFSTVTSLVMAASLVLVGPVLAVVPGNDTYAGRTVIGSVPFVDSIDTTEATPDAQDTEALGPCGGGALAVDASVWYEVTAGSDGGLVVDASGSDYSAAVVIATGGPSTFAFVTCGPGAVTFATSAGQAYAILAFDYQADGGGNGGTLNLTVAESAPPPEVVVTIDQVAHFNPRGGSATVTGTVSCTGGATVAFINIELKQKVGPFFVSGFGGSTPPCSETAQPWSGQVFTEGRFVGGQAAAVISAQACSSSGCGFDSEDRVVMLRR